MSQIRHIHIKNFRVIRELVWQPKPGLNCIIGPGDSGKSTVLDAIDLTLGARRSYPFTDADFFNLDTTKPIEIWVTLGALSEQLINIESYGMFLRSFDATSGVISDEPQAGQEIVITIKLNVAEDLEGDWLLYSDRAEKEKIERRLPWKHRELIAPARLGVASNHHLAWGGRSVLNKLSGDGLDITATLAQLSRTARQSFSGHEVKGIGSVLDKVKTLANNLGVPVGDLKALLDVNSVSLSHGAISLHNNDNSPLRQLGTGSARLLISGLQKSASTSNIFIVDEAEYGLEPYRISRLLNELGSKAITPTQQVFITTHSPYVLRELQAVQLHVIRKSTVVPFPPPNLQSSHQLYSLTGGDEQQSTLRVCAEAFFSQSVIVCEGKTEIGLVRGIDLFNQDHNFATIQSRGAYCADGGGDSMFARAKVFRSLGYKTAILKDSDKYAAHMTQSSDVQSLGIQLFEWGNNYTTEDALFNWGPAAIIPDLLELAIERKGRESINENILGNSDRKVSLDDCLYRYEDNLKSILANAAKSKNGAWYKDIEPAEKIGRFVIAPNYLSFHQNFRDPLNNLYLWAMNVGSCS